MPPESDHAFQVDLRSVVDLLARHVYSSPTVYLRELLQNSCDAVTARRELDPAAPVQPIRILPSDAGGHGALIVADGGIGLTEAEVHEFLATIGRSTKRDEFDLQRTGFVGRFGVGLLSCFVVSRHIELLTRSARGGPPVSFRGSEDGTYDVGTPGSGADPTLAGLLGSGPGTVVRLRPDPESTPLVEAGSVERLATRFGSLLPVPVLVGLVEGGERDVTDPEPAWLPSSDGGRSSRSRAAAREAWCERHLGFRPLDSVVLDVPAVGLTGTAYIWPEEIHPGNHPGHQVYLRRMFVGDAVQGLVPEWAFFARCVVDATELRPTASRESLVQDDALESAAGGIGDILRSWLVTLGTVDPARLRRVLAVHGRAAKSLAVHDDEVLEALAPWLTVETSEGAMTLPEIAARTVTARFTRTVDRFRQLAPIASAQNILVVNGGFSYDTDLLLRIGDLVPGAVAQELGDDDVLSTFDEVAIDRGIAAGPFLAAADLALDEVGCRVELKAFEPAVLPALFLHEPEARRRRDLRDASVEVDDDWAALLRQLDDEGDDRPRLICNDRHPLVGRLVDRAGSDPALVETTVRALYGQALLLGHRRMRAIDLAMLNRALLDLVERATRP